MDRDLRARSDACRARGMCRRRPEVGVHLSVRAAACNGHNVDESRVPGKKILANAWRPTSSLSHWIAPAQRRVSRVTHCALRHNGPPRCHSGPRSGRAPDRTANTFIIVHMEELFFLPHAIRYDIFISMNTTDIGELIRRRRAGLGIDQRALSEISGIAVHTLSNVEAGKGNPTLATLDRVLDALGMELRVQVKQ